METEKGVDVSEIYDNFYELHLYKFVSDELLVNSECFKTRIDSENLPLIFAKLADAIFSNQSIDFEGQFIQFEYEEYYPKVLLDSIVNLYRKRIVGRNFYTYVEQANTQVFYEKDNFYRDLEIRKIDLLANLAITMCLFFPEYTENLEGNARNLILSLDKDFFRAQSFFFRKLKEENSPLAFLSYGILMGNY